jgi:mRNA deadenylase 3'-5' endonuclease subunit Ccr4
MDNKEDVFFLNDASCVYVQPDEVQNFFSVASFNALGDGYARSEVYPYCPVSALKPEGRHRLILQCFEKTKAEVLILQEIDWNEELEGELSKMGYQLVFVKRPRQKKDGCLTAFKKDLFELVEMEEIDFNDVVMKPEIADTLAIDHYELSTVKDRFLRDNVAVLVRLKHSNSKREIVVANCHLYWNPSQQDVKLRQSVHLANQLEKFVRKTGDEVPMVLGGDFNSTPVSSVYDWFTNGKILETKEESVDTKLLIEGNLTRVAKWLRMMGVDAHYMPSDKNQYNAVFKLAREEDRVIISRSKTLVQRNGCPRFILLPNQYKPEEALRYIVARFGYPFKKSQLFSRCTFCNAVIRRIDVEYACTFPDIPEKFRTGKDDEGNDVMFFCCDACPKLYWWGHRSQGVIDDLRKALGFMEEDADVDEKDFKKPTEFKANHDLKLSSAYKVKNDHEPEFTNCTATFKGTLDYIFFNSHLEVENVVPLPTQKDFEQFTALPNVHWPSDHLMLTAKLKFK